MPIDAKSYRQVIGSFATGVTVVTTEVEGRLHGFTANAVSSLSLDPLLLLVCVDKEANAHAELERCGAFALSILASDQEDLSNLFAKSGEPQEGDLRGVGFSRGDTGAPLLDGAVAHLECEPHERLEGGDHTIVIGRVVGGSVSTDTAPLLYFQGAYRRLA